MQIRTKLPNLRPAFALPAVLIISTGVLILLVALMTVVGLERTTSKARAGSYQADLAVESGLEEAKMILAGVTATDTFAVGVIPFAAEYDDNGDGTISPIEDDELDVEDGERGRPYLYAIQGSADGDDPIFRLTPLFATHDGPGSERVRTDGELTLPDDPGLSLQQENNLDNRIAVRGTPHVQPPVTAWRTIRNQDGEPVARYSYWVEDLQGYLDAEWVPGNTRLGRHARANEVWSSGQIANESIFSEDILKDRVSSYEADGGKVPLWPAPGINPGYVEEVPGFLNPENRLLGEAAIFTIDRNETGVEDESQADDVIRGIAPQAITPSSLLVLNGAEAPIEREAVGTDRGRIALSGDGGTFEDRWLEENFITGNQSWEEQALVPFTPGISSRAMGRPRLNLNRLLDDAGSEESPAFGLVPGIQSRSETAVVEMASFMESALPDFAEKRRGGFPENYFQTLAAGALDYADANDEPTVKEGSYRGIDSHPLITEFATTTSWEWIQHEADGDPGAYVGKSFLRANGNLYILMTVEIFAELWNMSNHPIEGNVEIAYENFYEFPALGNPSVTFMGGVLDNQGGPGSMASFSSHQLEKKDDDYYYFPSRRLLMQPNEYRLIRAGAVRYGFLIGSDSQFIPQPIPTIDGDEGNAQYRMRWNGVLCDRTMGGLERPAITRLDTRAPKTKANVCGTWGPYGAFFTGMQDVRQSWWAGINQSFPEGMVSENSYPQNYTPGRRNVRYGSLSGRPNEPYARVLPSEWPDGGHDSSFDVKSFKSSTSSDRSIRPDDPRFVGAFDSQGRAGMWLQPEPMRAPMFLSNLGRFFSESELGNVYDPIMWKGDRNPGQSDETWPYADLDFAETPQVGTKASESEHVGGGNTLRIGRPEHEMFSPVNPAFEPGSRASRLLDLFHCGNPLSNNEQKRTGPLRKVEGHVNINTAPREVIRALAAGILVTDPDIGLEASFDTRNDFAPRLSRRFESISATDSVSGGAKTSDEAGLIADAIIAARPFVSRSQLADLIYPADHENARLRGRPVFGNKFNHSPGQRLQLTDRASEEVFGRVYNSTTIRSRNFRIHVIGQALEQTPSGNVRIKATRKKSYRVFANAGVRNQSSGAFDAGNLKIETLYETNL